MGKLVKVGNQRAIQDGDGNVKMIVANKFLISVEGLGRRRVEASPMPRRSTSPSCRR